MIRDTSLEALEQNKVQLGADEQRVFEVLLAYGPNHDRRLLEILNQKEAQKPRKSRRKWEINQVTGRRNGLLAKGYIRDLGKFKGLWHGKKKKYHFWAVNGDTRLPVGWQLVPKAARKTPPGYLRRPEISPSQAGRVLAKQRGKQTAIKSSQLTLF